MIGWIAYDSDARSASRCTCGHFPPAAENLRSPARRMGTEMGGDEKEIFPGA